MTPHPLQSPTNLDLFLTEFVEPFTPLAIQLDRCSLEMDFKNVSKKV
jgi:hypothetical protein